MHMEIQTSNPLIILYPGYLVNLLPSSIKVVPEKRMHLIKNNIMCLIPRFAWKPDNYGIAVQTPITDSA